MLQTKYGYNWPGSFPEVKNIVSSSDDGQRPRAINQSDCVFVSFLPPDVAHTIRAYKESRGFGDSVTGINLLFKA